MIFITNNINVSLQPGDSDSEPEKRFIIDQKTKQRINVPEFTFSLDENKNQGRTNTPK